MKAEVVRVRDGQWFQLAELGLSTSILVLTNKVTSPQLGRATGRASSRAVPGVSTAAALGSYRGWVRQQGWDRGAPEPTPRVTSAETACG